MGRYAHLSAQARSPGMSTGHSPSPGLWKAQSSAARDRRTVSKELPMTEFPPSADRRRASRCAWGTAGQTWRFRPLPRRGGMARQSAAAPGQPVRAAGAADRAGLGPVRRAGRRGGRSKRPAGSPNVADDGMIRAVSLMNGDGLRRIFTGLVDNFTGFAPLGVVLVAMLGVGVAEKSGLLSAAVRAMVLERAAQAGDGRDRLCRDRLQHRLGGRLRRANPAGRRDLLRAGPPSARRHGGGVRGGYRRATARTC